MNGNFTQKLLVKELYGETNQYEHAKINAALEEDWELQEEFESFKAVKEKLDAEAYRPSKTSIQIILDYSRKTAPLETSC